MRVKIRCSNCEQLLMVREEEVGTMGRCPACKQEITLAPAKQAAKPAAPVSLAAAPPKNPGVPLATGSGRQAATPISAPPQHQPFEAVALAVESIEDDVARRDSSLRGAIPVAVAGPAPMGRPRSPALAFLLALVFPPFAIYWYIVARGEMLAHLREPAGSAARIALGVLLLVVTAGIGAWIYCCYLVPKRVAQMQSKCGDPNRISPPSCLFVGVIPVLGWALNVLILQKALTRHWQWHDQRGSGSVTAGLAG